MALRGTLKDFGIADILQLIGHQNKTGILTARNKAQKVTVQFAGGGVIHAQAEKRQWYDLLGNMLVRAEVITQEQLDETLSVQRESKKRLGDILVEKGLVDETALTTFTRLQTTETVYQLFLWQGGTYEFEQAKVNVEPGAAAVRAEAILMEGFRQVDEWPMIRKKITGYNVTFRVSEDLERLVAQAEASGGEDFNLDGVFGEAPTAGPVRAGDQRLRKIGENERLVYRIIDPNRDVQKIIDLSRLGEFDTCKALANLVEAMIISPSTEGGRRPSAVSTVGGISAPRRGSGLSHVAHVAIAAAFLLAVWYAGRLAGIDPVRLIVSRQTMQYVDVSLQTELSRGQMLHLRHALSLYQAQTGDYPQRLDELVELGLVTPRDLSFPWKTPYHYRPEGDSFELFRPIY